MPNLPQFSIIVPAFNEELLIGSFLSDVIKISLQLGKPFEILVVANGCTDKTWDIASDYAKKYSQIKPIYLKESGYGRALYAGLTAAKGKYLIVLNVDFWDPKFIHITQVDLLGYDAVVGSKLLPGSVDNRGWGRRLVTIGFNIFLKIVFNYSGTDTHGIKVLRKSAFTPLINKCLTRSNIFDSELMIIGAKNKVKLLELPVTVSEIRPARFSSGRFLQTPFDLWQLYKAVSHV